MNFRSLLKIIVPGTPVFIWAVSKSYGGPAYKEFFRLEHCAPQLRIVDQILSPTGRVGFPFMEPFRILGRSLGWKICYNEHNFKFKVYAGEVGPNLTARSLYEFSKEVIGRTVPGAMRGGDGTLIGPRKHDAITTAIMGGQVRTTHDDEKLTMKNYAEPGHVFSEGFLELAFIEENGKVYVILAGGGKNNFSSLNQKFGSWIFPNMGRANIEAYRERYDLPKIKNTVEDITDRG